MKRAIHIFPVFAEMREINAIRKKYDPLASKIAPHVTLVFPFENLMATDELISHVKKVTRQISPFSITLGEAEEGDEGAIWLPIVAGREETKYLHDMLYTGPLRQHLSALYSYSPHLTVARVLPLNRPEALAAARGMGAIYESVVENIVIESILQDETSQIIFSIRLMGKPNPTRQ